MFFSLVREHAGAERAADLERFIGSRRPVVFIGPYEHHSNELTWREGLCTVVVVRLGRDGGIDLAHLEELLRDPRYLGRMRIGSFSAASNVTGLISPVRELAAMLHRHGAMACFDYAASAPYVRIDMNPPPGPAGEDARLDAVFISPHKFLGGPGSSGILVFNERIYRKDLAPSTSGGGTVAYVSRRGHDFFDDVEEREKAGTPGVLQTVKAALTFMVKEAVSVETIEGREQELLRRAFAKWRAHPRLEIMGDPDPARRIGVVSFNVRGEGGRYLHPKFVTVLLNDLFGIQSRAGCSCAGPYGHELLGIDETTSERYRAAIRQGFAGSSPAGAGSDSTIRWTTRTPTTSSRPSASWPAAAASSCRSTGSISGRGRGPTGAIRWPLRTFPWRMRSGREMNPPAVRCPPRCASASSEAYLDEAEALAAGLLALRARGDASCGDGRVPVLRASLRRLTAAGADNPLAVPVVALIGMPLDIRVESAIPIGLAMMK
ncbi:MAG: aminotransferase class V-fold PLP-dependent enzyme [Ignavibacteriales bacterium]|nr:aminotransferase class V-fold PLP-dependent enzyme [Ignavibacteriales bacterium]